MVILVIIKAVVVEGFAADDGIGFDVCGHVLFLARGSFAL